MFSTHYTIPVIIFNSGKPGADMFAKLGSSLRQHQSFAIGFRSTGENNETRIPSERRYISTVV